MKIFIIFLGLLVINVTALSFQGDMGKFVREQAFLKFSAEECAAGAAMLLKEDEYRQGKVVFDYEEGQRYADEYLDYIKQKSKLVGNLTCQLSFEDDQTGYPKESDSRPSVIATIKFETPDIFKLPFITLTEIQRSARYELK